ncbi:MAG: NERD domain-containing protein [Bacillus sp. (in: Bacteria)]|nr:NERD domain-containing protein [Bacillus sp. (in: firmicutes)]
MFAKECAISKRIKKYEAMDRRLDCNHLIRPDLLAEYKNWLAGYRGEKSVAFYLSMLSDSKYLIFHDLRLKLGKYYFQIDFLLLSSTFNLVLEVKNRIGEYRFEKNQNQTTLKSNGIEKRIKNPVLQAKLQAKKLKKWLKKYNCPEVPIYYLFVNSNEKAIIRIEPGNEQINQYICHSEALVERIDQLANFYKTEILNASELRKIKRLLLAHHTPDDPDLLHHFNLSAKHITPGVQCQECGCLPMKYHYGTWSCSICKHKSKIAHYQAIEDYFLLVKPTISNSELRQFLQIKSPKSANTILHTLNFSYSGTNKNRVYFLEKQQLDFLNPPKHPPKPSKSPFKQRPTDKIKTN